MNLEERRKLGKLIETKFRLWERSVRKSYEWKIPIFLILTQYNEKNIGHSG